MIKIGKFTFYKEKHKYHDYLFNQGIDFLLSFGKLLLFLVSAVTIIQRDVLVKLCKLSHLLSLGLRCSHNILFILSTTQGLV